MSEFGYQKYMAAAAGAVREKHSAASGRYGDLDFDRLYEAEDGFEPDAAGTETAVLAEAASSGGTSAPAEAGASASTMETKDIAEVQQRARDRMKELNAKIAEIFECLGNMQIDRERSDEEEFRINFGHTKTALKAALTIAEDAEQEFADSGIDTTPFINAYTYCAQNVTDIILAVQNTPAGERAAVDLTAKTFEIPGAGTAGVASRPGPEVSAAVSAGPELSPAPAAAAETKTPAELTREIMRKLSAEVSPALNTLRTVLLRMRNLKASGNVTEYEVAAAEAVSLFGKIHPALQEAETSLQDILRRDPSVNLNFFKVFRSDYNFLVQVYGNIQNTQFGNRAPETPEAAFKAAGAERPLAAAPVIRTGFGTPPLPPVNPDQLERARQAYFAAKAKWEQMSLIGKHFPGRKRQEERTNIEAEIQRARREYETCRAAFLLSNSTTFEREQEELLKFRVQQRDLKHNSRSKVVRAAEKVNRAYERAGELNLELFMRKHMPQALDKFDRITTVPPSVTIKGKRIPLMELHTGRAFLRGMSVRTAVNLGLLGVGISGFHFGAMSAVGKVALLTRRGLAGFGAGVGSEKIVDITTGKIADWFMNGHNGIDALSAYEAKCLAAGKSFDEIQSDPQYRQLLAEVNAEIQAAGASGAQKKLMNIETAGDKASAARKFRKVYSGAIGGLAAGFVGSGLLAKAMGHVTHWGGGGSSGHGPSHGGGGAGAVERTGGRGAATATDGGRTGSAMPGNRQLPQTGAGGTAPEQTGGRPAGPATASEAKGGASNAAGGRAGSPEQSGPAQGATETRPIPQEKPSPTPPRAPETPGQKIPASETQQQPGQKAGGPRAGERPVPQNEQPNLASEKAAAQTHGTKPAETGQPRQPEKSGSAGSETETKQQANQARAPQRTASGEPAQRTSPPVRPPTAEAGRAGAPAAPAETAPDAADIKITGRGIEGTLLDLKNSNPALYQKMIGNLKDTYGNIKPEALVHRYVLDFAQQHHFAVGANGHDLNRLFGGGIHIGANGEISLSVENQFMPVVEHAAPVSAPVVEELPPPQSPVIQYQPPKTILDTIQPSKPPELHNPAPSALHEQTKGWGADNSSPPSPVRAVGEGADVKPVHVDAPAAGTGKPPVADIPRSPGILDHNRNYAPIQPDHSGKALTFYEQAYNEKLARYVQLKENLANHLHEQETATQQFIQKYGAEDYQKFVKDGYTFSSPGSTRDYNMLADAARLRPMLARTELLLQQRNLALSSMETAQAEVILERQGVLSAETPSGLSVDAPERLLSGSSRTLFTELTHNSRVTVSQSLTRVLHGGDYSRLMAKLSAGHSYFESIDSIGNFKISHFEELAQSSGEGFRETHKGLIDFIRELQQSSSVSPVQSAAFRRTHTIKEFILLYAMKQKGML